MSALVAYFVAAGSRFWFLLGSLLAYITAKRIVVATTYITVVAALFVAMAGVVKIAILALRVNIPASLAAGTFLLPASINSFIAAVFTIRLTYFIWTWTHRNLTTFVNLQDKNGLI